MKTREQIYCNRCGRKVDWDWKYNKGSAFAKAWSIWFPSQTAGGSAGNSLDDYCWECYGKVCNKLEKIYNYEKSNEVTFETNIKVKVKKKLRI